MYVFVSVGILSIDLDVDFFRYIFGGISIPSYPLSLSLNRGLLSGGRAGAVGRGEEGGYGVRCFPPFTTLLFKHTANQKLPRSTPARPHSTKMKILNKIRSNSVSQYPRASSLHDSLYSNQLRTLMERHGTRTNKHAFERRLVGISLSKTIE